MSKATIVSFFPREFDERVPHIFPSRYFIPASDGQIPQLLVIEDATYYIENFVGDNVQKIPIRVTAEELANSLTSDFRTSLIQTSEDAYPAIFWVSGEIDYNGLMKNHKAKVEEALRYQRNWLLNLVKTADDLWERFHQHRAIGTLERIAAKQLMLNRPWIDTNVELIRCPACNNPVSPVQAVCTNCRCIINKDAYKKLEFATTG